MKDDDDDPGGAHLADLFDTTPVYEDAARFEAQIMRRLKTALWLRWGCVGVAACIGWLFALVVWIRMPGVILSRQALADVMIARVKFDQILQSGIDLLNGTEVKTTGLLHVSSHSFNLMQMPVFYGISFSLYLVCVGLYYAYSQEETL